MGLEDIKVYEIEITGHLTISGPNDNKVLDAARAYLSENIAKLGFSLTEHDGFEWVEPPPPP